MIKNNASINEDASGDLEGLKREIRKLRAELDSARGIITALESNCQALEIHDQDTGAGHSHLLGSASKIRNMEHAKEQLIEENHYTMQIESILMSTIDALGKSQHFLEKQTNQKESYLKIFKKAVRVY